MHKLNRWIDLQNERLCLAINQIYNQKIDLSYSVFYAFKPLLYPYYFARLLFIVFNFFRFNKKLYEPYLWAWRKSNYLELLFTLLGLRFFLNPNKHVHYYNEKVKLSDLTLEQKSTVLVSIIIYNTNEIKGLETCLKSLFLNVSPTYSYEIIVVHQHSATHIQERLKVVKGLIFTKTDQNTNHINSCFNTISVAQGKYICLLNAQTIVLPMWLESLIETIQDDPEVGCVGPKALTSQGLIKQAGGIIDENGHLHTYGDYEHPSMFKYDYKRPVDFCYPINILLKKTDFEQIATLDNRIDNSIYGAIDIGFSIRHYLRKKIIYQPESAIMDLQIKPASYPTEPCSAFVLKWQNILTSQYKFTDLETAATRFLPQKTISVIDSYLPFFDKESGSNRLFHLLKIFQQLNYHVNFIPNDGKYVAPYYRILTAKLGIPVAYNCYGHRQFKQAIFNMINRTEILWISRPNLNLKYQYLVKNYPKVKWIYDTVDLHYVRLLRQATSEIKPRLVKKSTKIKVLELALASAADATIAITAIEKEVLEKDGIKNVYVIPNVHEIKKIEQPVSFTESKGIVFIGGYKHKPNVDAVIWLMKEIMPLVNAKLGEMPVYLLGTYPTPEILALRSNSVLVPGYLHDVNPYFLNSRLFVAPLRYGAGMKGKIGQSLEYGLPIVSTTIGAEGMNLTHDQNVLIADDAQNFAEQIVRLYQDQAVWEKIKDNSLKSIEAYTPKMVGEKLQSLFEKIQETN